MESWINRECAPSYKKHIAIGDERVWIKLSCCGKVDQGNKNFVVYGKSEAEVIQKIKNIIDRDSNDIRKKDRTRGCNTLFVNSGGSPCRRQAIKDFNNEV